MRQLGEALPANPSTHPPNENEPQLLSHGASQSLSAFSNDAKQGFERIAFPLCGALALLGTGVAAFIPTHRVEALSFLIGTAVLSFIVLRFSSARVACFLAAASATVISAFDIWLRGATTPLVAITLVLTVLSSAFFWERQIPPLYGLATALLVALLQMGILESGWRAAFDGGALTTQWETGSLMVPLALLVVGLSAYFLPPRFPARVAPPPLAEQDRRGRPTTQLIEGLPHAVAVFDRHSRLIAANSVWRRLHSATPDDPSGLHSGTLELHERGSDAFRRCLLGEDINDQRTMLLKPDGAREWISTSMSPWYEEGDGVVIGGVIITKTNVTSEVELEEEIESISTQLSLAEAAAAAVASQPTSLDVPSDLNSEGATNDSSLESSPSLASGASQHTDGRTTVRSDADHDPEPDSDTDSGGQDSTHGAPEDHTLRTSSAAQDQLVAQYLRVFPEVLFVLDRDACVTDVHAAEESQGNLAGMDLVGTEISMAFPSLYDATRPKSLDSLRERGDVRVEEFEIPSGRRDVPIRYEARMAALDDGGFVLLNRELPNLKAASRGAKTETDTEVSFVSATAHDLQEPLRQISNHLELLEERHLDQLDEEGRDLLESAANGSRRLKCILSGVLDFTAAGQSAVTHETIDLQDALNEALSGLEHRIDEAGAHVFTSEMPKAEGDLQDIATVFQNLLINSLNYRSKRHPEIEIEASQANGLVQIDVTDNGIGIPPDDSDSVFNAFLRLNSDSGVEGSGLGLAICRRLVERHGGKIWIQPHKAAGTRVAFTLPASTRHANIGTTNTPRSEENRSDS